MRTPVADLEQAPPASRTYGRCNCCVSRRGGVNSVDLGGVELGGCAVMARRLSNKKAGLVGQVPGQLILQSQLLFLEAVEKVFVGVGSMLFFLDEGMKSLMLRLEFLDNCLVHWCGSFRSACHHPPINHESRDLSW